MGTGITQFLTEMLEMMYSTSWSGGSHSSYERKQIFAHFTRLIERIIIAGNCGSREGGSQQGLLGCKEQPETTAGSEDALRCLFNLNEQEIILLLI